MNTKWTNQPSSPQYFVQTTQDVENQKELIKAFEMLYQCAKLDHNIDQLRYDIKVRTRELYCLDDGSIFNLELKLEQMIEDNHYRRRNALIQASYVSKLMKI